MKKILLITLIFQLLWQSLLVVNRQKNGEYDSLQVSNSDEINSEETSPEESQEEATRRKMICNKFL